MNVSIFYYGYVNQTGKFKDVSLDFEFLVSGED